MPSECGTQFQEARWAHLRALFHRGNRGGGVQAAGDKGKPFLLSSIADDQAHLVYILEFGVHSDLHTQHGQSHVTGAETKAAAASGEASFNQNTHIPEWVMKQAGVQDDWTHFERLFLTPACVGGFKVGEQFYTTVGADAGIVGCTAEKAGHRRSGLRNSGAVLQHLNRMPAEASIDTDVTKDVRLMIDPQRKEGEEVVSSAAVQLIFRTKVSDKIIGGQSIERKPTEVVKHVSKEQLVEIVKAYREEHEGLSTQVDEPAISDMVVGDKHGDERSLR